MSQERYRFVFLGLSITSSWGNGHATTYRGLLKALAARGHEVVFLERDAPWYAENRDLPAPPYAATHLYRSTEELFDRHRALVSAADLVVVGSYVADGCAIGKWACSNAPGRVAFYDIDTPVTLAKIDAADEEYISREVMPLYSLYLSFTGGPTLVELEKRYGARRARPLYRSVDTDVYQPYDVNPIWDLGYLGTYSEDRQPAVERLLFEVARRAPACLYVVAGAQYPASLRFPPNVEHIEHLAPADHAAFYGAQRCTLNVTRQAMVRRGWSPSVRLFEAASCAVPIVSDAWPGIEHFLTPGSEITIARTTREVFAATTGLDEKTRRGIGEAARRRVLAQHTAAHRAETLEGYTRELLERNALARAKRGKAAPADAPG